jgi:hypothetical protein
MSKTSKDPGRFSFLLSIAIATSAAWGAAQTPAAPFEQQVKMQVRVYDYAQVPPVVLAKAEEQADKIFLQARVDVAWENLTPPKDPSQAKPVSPHPPCSAGIDLRIVPHFKSSTRMLRYDSMGFAVPPDTATISLSWVGKLASLGIAEEYQVLGVAIAHEIGHLFLGPNSHSPAGIMRAGWKEQDLLEASQARLTFTPDQARRIQTEVRHRQKKQGLAEALQRTGITGVQTPCP